MTSPPGLSIAVVGPGAIGGTVAAWLSRSARVASLTLCARTPLDRLVVEAPDGRRIEAHPRVITAPSDITAPVDWVLVATKAYDVAAASAWLAPLVGPKTRVAVLQNGVEHVERFVPFVAAGRIVPVVVDIPAERTAPGRIHHRREGTVVVPAGPAGDAFVTLFAESPIAASTTDDFTTVAWTKLALNCAGAVNALTGRPGGVVREAGIADLMRGMVEECVRVGRAVGADLGDHLPDWVVERAETSPPDSINSLLADRLAGRPMEWDARNGVIARLGATHGIATPLNLMAANILAVMK
ncbi:2-dehydropantoate 2-reductase [Brevundimonas subvibrioides]|uniref:2-dehydropantoate 2-reductase n=1 Tax=Brevundimonas subvibrioides (strain ATCC 15264 / DSM 4735 / LMG 14903 / NBRC 16000 / CB 81) TaxID=633149 RepID=D9QMR8_BRESC|nr:2-dehydropantoate 2-reductase [Brevundimonas subvibrioides]ADL02074.1 2-dehydropantoate 2-reductase [Brevundimonas subvibrioides ATCC 15264]